MTNKKVNEIYRYLRAELRKQNLWNKITKEILNRLSVKDFRISTIKELFLCYGMGGEKLMSEYAKKRKIELTDWFEYIQNIKS